MDRSTKFLLSAVAIAIAAPLVLALTVFAGALGAVDLALQVLLLVVTVPLIALSVFMWGTGKGAMLVAGYNTSPKRVRDLYDHEAMTKFVGMLMTAFMVFLLVGIESLVLLDNTVLFWALFLIGITVLLSGLLFMNTGGRFLKKGVSRQEARLTAEERKRNRKLMAAALVIIAVVLVAVFALTGSGSVSASLEEDGFRVSAPLVNDMVLYEDVTSVELRNDLDAGRRVGGFGGTVVSSGNFENDEFGRYVLARYNSVESCIVVHHSGGVLAFNLGSAEGTAYMYDELRSRL